MSEPSDPSPGIFFLLLWIREEPNAHVQCARVSKKRKGRPNIYLTTISELVTNPFIRKLQAQVHQGPDVGSRGACEAQLTTHRWDTRGDQRRDGDGGDGLRSRPLTHLVTHESRSQSPQGGGGQTENAKNRGAYSCRG